MTVNANPIDGAVIQSDGSLIPMGREDASVEAMHPPAGMAAPPTPIAMTNGRQMSAARTD